MIGFKDKESIGFKAGQHILKRKEFKDIVDVGFLKASFDQIYLIIFKELLKNSEIEPGRSFYIKYLQLDDEDDLIAYIYVDVADAEIGDFIYIHETRDKLYLEKRAIQDKVFENINTDGFWKRVE